MGLPQFPDMPAEIPEQIDLLHLLMQSVALEELSLAALVNAEAEKVQELVQQGIAGPIFAEEAILINESVRDVVKAAGDKEDKLLRKLRIILAAKEAEENNDNDNNDNDNNG